MFVSLVKFTYCFKFHVNIITGSGVVTVFFYERSRNQKYFYEFCPISGDWGELEISNLAQMPLPKYY